MISSSFRFVDDLVPLILEAHNNWWPCDLLRLARVSPAWLAHVRKRLYACPHLRSFSACSKLARSLSANPRLSSLMHGIDIRPSASGVLTEKEMISLRHILSLDGLRIITLGGELAVGAERFLNSLANPEVVTELAIDGTMHGNGGSYLRSCKPASLEWDETLAYKFPNLRKLRLSNLELDICYPSVPYELDITELVIDNVEITDGYLHYLLNQSWHSLRHLSVLAKCASEYEEHMKLMLEFCGPTLQSLQYDVRDTRATDALFDTDSTPCPSLHKLFLDGIDVDFDLLSSIRTVCMNLEELSISGRSVRVPAQQWAEFLCSGSLPKLRHLSTPWGTKSPPFKHWSQEEGAAVLNASSKRNIQLSYPIGSSNCF